VRAHGRLSPPYLCVKPAPSKAFSGREGDTNTKNFYRYGVCEILISETEKRPALYDCSIKEYSDKSFEDRLCEAVVRF
jgi:hypothetical protein